MRTLLLIFASFILIAFVTGCSEGEEPVPCVYARVVDVADPCSGGVVLEISDEEQALKGMPRCGNDMSSRYVTVDNLPENLRYVDARFTCQIKESASGKVCPSIYMMYEAVTITNICSQSAQSS